MSNNPSSFFYFYMEVYSTPNSTKGGEVGGGQVYRAIVGY